MDAISSAPSYSSYTAAKADWESKRDSLGGQHADTVAAAKTQVYWMQKCMMELGMSPCPRVLMPAPA